MGQPIEVERRVQGEVAVFTGNRSLTGQDGAGYHPGDSVTDNGKLSAEVARRFFELDPAIDYVYVANNNVMARRPGGWNEAALDAAGDALRRFFVFYDGAAPVHVEEVPADADESPIGGEGAGIVMVEAPGGMTQDEIESLRAANYNATISYLRRAHEDLWIFGVKPDGGPLDYAAGQYTTLALGFWEPRIDDLTEELDDEQRRKLARRSYSVSSSILDADGELIDPSAQEAAEFYVVLVQSDWQGTPAVLTPRLFLKDEGDRLFIGKKAAGRYRLDKFDDPDATVIFLSTGTGEAPNNRMTLDLLRAQHRGKIVGVCTTRYKRDLAYLETHRLLEERFANYTYIPLTTREPENEGTKVYIQDLIESGELEKVADVELDPASTHVYLCGNPLMIGLPEWDGDTPIFPETRGVAEILAGRGFEIDHGREVGNIHYEEYW
jgi:ferredoxin/flavodoxin---NADP+ reductase